MKSAKVRIGENVTNMLNDDEFRGFYLIYTLVDEDGVEVQCFFRPDLTRVSGIERRFTVLNDHVDLLDMTITEVALVSKTEWYTKKLDYNVELYGRACKDSDRANNDFWENRMSLKEYTKLHVMLELTKDAIRDEIRSLVDTMTVHEIDVKNELAIEIINFADSTEG